MATQKSNKKCRFVFPFILRHVIAETTQYLQVAGIEEFMDLPMNAEIKSLGTSGEETTDERVTVYYAGGFRITAKLTCGSGHFGGEYSLTELSLRWKGVMAAEKVAKMQAWSGPGEVKQVDHAWDDKARSTTLTLTGAGLHAMRCNSSWARYGQALHKWDDADHPRHMAG